MSGMFVVFIETEGLPRSKSIVKGRHVSLWSEPQRPATEAKAFMMAYSSQASQ